MSEMELEQHVQDCGRHMEQAYARGDREEAQRWLALQNEAINSRTPEMVRLLEQQRGLA